MNNKNGFTMIEIVFVILIIGIITIFLRPNFGDIKLLQATDQLIFHIRYTQHLAMVDNRYDINDEFWFKTYWQIMFTKTQKTNNQWSYVIFSDKLGNHTGNPDPLEIARNPLDTNKLLTGGSSGNGFIHFDDPRATKNLNIGTNYNIRDVNFSENCKSYNSMRISFDNIGRPLYGPPNTLTSPYMANSKSRILKERCVITLTSFNNNFSQIAIEPETGYVFVLRN